LRSRQAGHGEEAADSTNKGGRAAATEVKETPRMSEPVSVLRQPQRDGSMSGFEPLFDTPVTMREPTNDESCGRDSSGIADSLLADAVRHFLTANAFPFSPIRESSEAVPGDRAASDGLNSSGQWSSRVRRTRTAAAEFSHPLDLGRTKPPDLSPDHPVSHPDKCQPKNCCKNFVVVLFWLIPVCRHARPTPIPALLQGVSGDIPEAERGAAPAGGACNPARRRQGTVVTRAEMSAKPQRPPMSSKAAVERRRARALRQWAHDAPAS